MLLTKRKPPIRKRSFLLFELLISLSLLTLCLYPLIKSQFEVQRGHLKELKKLEREQIVNLRFSKLKEAMFEQIFPWNSLLEGTSYTLPTGEEIALIALENTKKKSGTKGALVEGTLKLDEEEFTRFFFVKQGKER